MDQLIMYDGVSNPLFRAAVAEYPWWQSYKNNTTLEAQYPQILAATSCGYFGMPQRFHGQSYVVRT